MLAHAGYMQNLAVEFLRLATKLLVSESGNVFLFQKCFVLELCADCLSIGMFVWFLSSCFYVRGLIILFHGTRFSEHGLKFRVVSCDKSVVRKQSKIKASVTYIFTISF